MPGTDELVHQSARIRLGVMLALLCLESCKTASLEHVAPWVDPRANGSDTAADGGNESTPSEATDVSGESDAGLDAATQQQETAPALPTEPILARLTRAQYVHVVRDLLGPELDVPDLEPDQRLFNFSVIGAGRTTVSEHGVDLYSRAAFSIAKQAFADPARRAKFVSCQPQSPLDPTCLGQFVKEFGLRAFRRPLSSGEQARYEALAGDVALDDPWRALEFVTAAFLQSPNFLYRVEVGVPVDDRPGWRRYTGYEMASRLSFLLRNTAPDKHLLTAAESGELDSRDGVVNAAARLLDDAKPTEAMLAELYSEYLDLPLLDGVRFPDDMNTNKTLAQSLRGEVLEIVKTIGLRESADMRTMFTTRRFAVNSDLAALNGFPATTSAKLQLIELPDNSPRGGILTTGALLALNNRPNRTSPTIRGLFVRQRLLCGSVPPPPAGIPPIDDSVHSEALTIREKLAEHRSNPACAGCHVAMDPIGLGMEDFDRFGLYRTEYENGQPVDASGEVEGIEFNGARELGDILAKDPRVMDCLVKQIYRYSSSRMETAADEQTLKSLNVSFRDSGYQLRPLLLDLVASDEFRFTAEAAE